MSSPELFVLAINAAILTMAYLWVYPRFAGGDINRLATNDLVANLCALLVSGFFFYDSGVRFNFFIVEVGWFGFTFASFLLMELPFFLWYVRRYGLFKG